MVATLEIVESHLIGRDEPGSGAGLDRHIADGHARFHGQRPDGLTPVLQDIALTADRGWKDALRADPALALGLNTDAGHITYGAVAEAFGMDSISLDEALS